jgi:mannose-6-phosphate isomerase-like protein (cupin superfamily)
VTTPSPPSLGHAADAPDTRAPDGSEIRILVDARHGATRASAVDVRLPAGGVSRPVRHRTVEEIWLITSGRGRVWRSPADGDIAPIDVCEGDALVIPIGWRFQFAAARDAELRLVCFTTPPWPGSDEAEPAEPGALGPATV